MSPTSPNEGLDRKKRPVGQRLDHLRAAGGDLDPPPVHQRPDGTPGGAYLPAPASGLPARRAGLQRCAAGSDTASSSVCCRGSRAPRRSASARACLRRATSRLGSPPARRATPGAVAVPAGSPPVRRTPLWVGRETPPTARSARSAARLGARPPSSGPRGPPPAAARRTVRSESSPRRARQLARIDPLRERVEATWAASSSSVGETETYGATNVPSPCLETVSPSSSRRQYTLRAVLTLTPAPAANSRTPGSCSSTQPSALDQRLQPPGEVDPHRKIVGPGEPGGSPAPTSVPLN